MKKSSIRRLPDSELEVMQAVWACSQHNSEARQECDVRQECDTRQSSESDTVSRSQIEEMLQENQAQPMALTTLLTLLSRLTEKGFLEVKKEGRSNAYTPLISKEDYLAVQSRRFLDKLCGGSLSTFANALCDSGLTKEELDELRQLLERGQL